MRITALFLITFLFTSLFAQKPQKEIKTYIAARVNSSAPVINGNLDDEIWSKARTSSGFTQTDPIEGSRPSEKTAFKILYDDKNLYVALIAYDSEPDKITSRVARRDDVDDSDFILIGFDSYYDHRTSFVFGLNASGVKADFFISEDGDNTDDSWDPVWEGKTSINDSGWVAEMRIPYSQIRFGEKEKHIWGLQIYRKIHRKKEEMLWQFIPKDAGGMVSYFGKLTGIENIKMPARVELLPYAVTQLNTYEKDEGNPFADGRDFNFTGGIDGKIGLTGDLTVDFTVNPDFGQVEADPSEVNLSTFETFLEEKRPFFIEGKNIFNFRLAMGDGDFASENLFYSRRIGRRPQYYPDEEDGFYYDYEDVPDQTSILGAAKLSGKTKTGWSIGILDAVTAKEEATIELDSARKSVTVEPLTNYFVTRLQKDYNEGNTSLGCMITAVNRKINEDHLNFLNKSAYTGGIDFRRQWDDKTYLLDLKLAFSHIRGHEEALQRVQTSSARYFQRPDAKHITLDSSRTTLNGYGGSFNIGRLGNSRWRFLAGGIWRSPGLELNDVGYLRRADQIMQFVWAGYRITDPVSIFRRINVNFNQWNGWNFGGEKLFAGGNIDGGAQFLNYWGFYLGINREGDGLSPYSLRGGPSCRYEGAWNNWYNIYSDSRKSWQIEFGGFNHSNDDGNSYMNNYRFSLFLKMSERISLTLRPFYNLNLDNLQYISTEEYENEDRYIFGKLDQHTFGLVFRLNYCPTPELSIQYYGQPFVSAGKYSEFKRAANPRAQNYKDQYYEYASQELSCDIEDEVYYVDENNDGSSDYLFDIPDFNFKQFRSNLVIRWEYLPGSIAYLVWSQGRTDFEIQGNFNFSNDLQNVFKTHPDNIFLIKLNYWFSI
jgi:hypothetical protein